MLVCLACYENRLASVFENCAELRLYRIDGDEICPAGRLPLPSKDPMDRISATLACGATFLLCGAVCGRTRQALEQARVSVRPWVTGQADEVVKAFAGDRLEDFAMPGCVCRGGGPEARCPRSMKGRGGQRRSKAKRNKGADGP